MKLHLPTSFRKALLACLATLITPTLTLSSASLAADDPTLWDFERTLGDESAYELTKVGESDDYTFVTYTWDEKGNPIAHYYYISYPPLPTTVTNFTGVAFSWIDDATMGKTLHKENSITGDIVYNHTAGTNGRHLEFKNGTLTLGSGAGEKNYHWDWFDFGSYEYSHDSDGTDENQRENDKLVPKPGGWHYSEHFDEHGLPTIGIAGTESEYKWGLAEGAGTSNIVFHYDTSGTSRERTDVAPGVSQGDINGLYENRSISDDLSVKIEELLAPQISVGGAISNQGNIGAITADFVDNTSLNRITVTDSITNISKVITNAALGGAIYNEGEIQIIKNNGFVNNSAQSEILIEQTIFLDDKRHILDLKSSAAGGAIYNSGKIANSVAGDFIGNNAFAFHWPKGGVNYSSKNAGETIILRATGGAIFNGISDYGSQGEVKIESVSGNFIGNYAESLLTMGPHGSASFTHVDGSYNAFGGAIYNGIGEITDSADNLSTSIGDITGNFVGNYAYNYHLTQQNDGDADKKNAIIKTYTLGGAIYNGIDKVSADGGRVVSSVGTIDGTFIGNYVYDVDPYLCGEHIDRDSKDESKITNVRHLQLGDWYVNKEQSAYGGAIYNGLADIENTGAELTVSVDRIEGDYVGNYAYAKSYKSHWLDVNPAPTSTSAGANTQNDKESATLTASGGAIYNGVAAIDNSSNVKSIIKQGINGTFTGNYAYIVRLLGGDPAKNNARFGFGYVFEEDSAQGGAIYNGITDVSIKEGLVSASIGDIHKAEGYITGTFTENYTLVKENTYLSPTYALGGAIYNGVHYVTYINNYAKTPVIIHHNLVEGGEVQATIAGIYDSAFIGNYASILNINNKERGAYQKQDYAFGGAVYNGILGLSGQTGGEVNSIIGAIEDVTFVKNHASTDNKMTNIFKDSVITHHAYGGAIYNGIEKSDGENIHADIKSITGQFEANYAENLVSATSGMFYTFGGAIYNGLENISDHSGEIVTTIENITASFKDNYASNSKGSTAALLYSSKGGAIYNGLNKTAGAEGHLLSEIRSITGDFSGNYAEGYTEARGGAVYNGLSDFNADGYIVKNKPNVTSASTSVTIPSTDITVTARPSNLKEEVINEYSTSNSRTYMESNAVKKAEIGSIGGHFTKNHVSGSIARGGAIHNAIDEVVFSNGSINNEQAISMGYSPAPSSKSDIIVKFERAELLSSTNKMNNEFSDELNNKGGKLESSIGNITGDFIENSASSTRQNSSDAKGGAIYNSVEAVKGDTGNITNSNKYAYINYSGTITGSKNVTIEYADKTYLANKLQNQYDSVINNSEHGSISSSIGVITGDFIKNSATSTGDVKGGAVYNSLGTVSGASGMVTNMNRDSNAGVQSHNFAPTFSSTKNENIHLIYGGEGEILNEIKSEIRSSFDNSNGSIISSTVDEINGNFIGNSTETKVKTAQGGALYNGIDEVSGCSSTIVNSNNNRYYFYFYDQGKGTSTADATFSATYKDTYIIENTYEGTFDNSDGSVIRSHVGEIEGSFMSNKARGVSAEGGAVYNGIGSIIGGHLDITNINKIAYDKYTNANYLAQMTYIFKDLNWANRNTVINTYRATINNSGGTIESVIDAIDGDFTDNHAIGTTGAVHGGAVYNGIGNIAGCIGTIINENTVTSEFSELLKQSNINEATNNISVTLDNTGGTICVSIGDINSNFYKNTAESYAGEATGGAIYNGIGSVRNADVAIENTETGGKSTIANNFDTAFKNKDGIIIVGIDNIKGNFLDNKAESTSGNAHGGAIYNGIGVLDAGIEGTLDARIGVITGTFRGNTATATKGNALGAAIYNSGSIGWFGDDDTAEGAYDGTVTGGVLNSQFYNNVAVGTAAHGGGIWTSGRLAIVANGGNTVFSGNTAGGESSGLYIGSADSVVYLIAQGLGTITFDDIIEGTPEQGKTLNDGKVSTLRLRGYTLGGTTPTDVGGVYLNHYVKNTHALMDDVTLYLGVSHEKNTEATGAVDKTRVNNTATGVTYGAEYISYIMEGSNLTAQSGVVNTVDGAATNYRINRLVTTGRVSVGKDAPYAGYAIDIVPDMLQGETHTILPESNLEQESKLAYSDVFTVGNGSKGYVTVSQISVDPMRALQGDEAEDGTERDDDYGYHYGNRKDGGFNNYEDIYVQIINYEGDDYTAATADEMRWES